jgi:hypothetical protein
MSPNWSETLRSTRKTLWAEAIGCIRHEMEVAIRDLISIIYNWLPATHHCGWQSTVRKNLLHKEIVSTWNLPLWTTSQCRSLHPATLIFSIQCLQRLILEALGVFWILALTLLAVTAVISWLAMRPTTVSTLLFLWWTISEHHTMNLICDTMNSPSDTLIWPSNTQFLISNTTLLWDNLGMLKKW